MGLFKKAKTAGPVFRYSDKETEEIEQFIGEQFGNYSNVLHELVSPDIHLDVCVVDPTESEPYYKLVTMGAGAYRMNVPRQYRQYNLEHAEYVICLPSSWNLQSDDEKDYWPIRALKDTARLPVWCKTWLCYGHTAQPHADGSSYADNTLFNSIVLDEAIKDNSCAQLSSGKVVNFWKLVPLYPEELRFCMENGADALFDLMEEKGTCTDALDLTRANTVSQKEH